MDFRIGLNNMKNSRHPENFVVLRHAPVDRSTFDSIQKSALKNFDSIPTWHMATPHNIRRKTPQNSDCNSCHGNVKLFLKNKDVEPDFRAANRSVIVEDAGIPGRRK